MNTIRKNVMFTLNANVMNVMHASSYVDTNVPIRYYSKHLIHVPSIRYYSRCSLDQLARKMEYYYNSQPSLFVELRVDKVRSLQKAIRRFQYSLPPLQLRVFQKLDQDQLNGIVGLKPPVGSTVKERSLAKGVVSLPYYVYNTSINEIRYYFYYSFSIKQGDLLVLMALAGMLNERIAHFHRPTRYYKAIRKIAAQKPISRIFIIDMRLPLSSDNKLILRRILKPIVRNVKIMQFIKEVLYMPIHYKGMDISQHIKQWLPSELLSCLVNIYLIELDKVFHDIFPSSSFTYTRYAHEVIVTTTHNVSDSWFEAEFFVFFDKLYLDGDIRSIGPGDKALTCYNGGVIWLTKEGILNVMEKQKE